MKLQEAYASENNAVGTWPQIGYKGPGEQTANNASTSKTSSFGYSNTAAGNWIATSSVALNDCASGSTWTVTTAYTASNGSITTTVGSSNEGACVTPLVPNFCKIATSGRCTAAANNSQGG